MLEQIELWGLYQADQAEKDLTLGLNYLEHVRQWKMFDIIANQEWIIFPGVALLVF